MNLILNVCLGITLTTLLRHLPGTTGMVSVGYVAKSNGLCLSQPVDLNFAKGTGSAKDNLQEDLSICIQWYLWCFELTTLFAYMMYIVITFSYIFAPHKLFPFKQIIKTAYGMSHTLWNFLEKLTSYQRN